MKEKISYFTILFFPFTIGFGAQLGQVILLRELFVVFSGNEFSLGIAFAGWLSACGLGAGVCSLLLRFCKRIRLLWNTITLLTLLALGGAIWVIRSSRQIFEVSRGQSLTLWELSLTAFVALGTSAFFFGCQYVISIYFLSQRMEEGANRAYLFEALGALVGGGLFTFLFVYLPSYQILAIVAVAFLFVACLAWRKEGRLVSSKGGIILLIFLFLVGIPLIKGGAFLDRKLEQRRWALDLGIEYHLKKNFFSPFGQITHLSKGTQQYIYYNGFSYLTFPNRSAGAAKAHLLLNQHPSPKNIFLLGGGPQGLSEMILYPFETLDYLELDPYLLDLSLELASREDRLALKDRRISVYHQDGRAFLISAPPQKYSLMALFVPPPSTVALNRYYTAEFFAQVKRVLRPGGVLILTLESAYSLDETSKKARQNRLIYRTLCKYFKNIKILPGDTNLLICTDRGENTSLDPEVLASRFLSQKISSPHYTARYLAYSKATRQRPDFLKNAMTSLFEGMVSPRHIHETMMAYRDEKSSRTTTPVLPWLRKSKEKQELLELYQTPTIPADAHLNTDEKPLAPLYHLLAWNSEVGQGKDGMVAFFLKIPWKNWPFFLLILAGSFVLLALCLTLIGQRKRIQSLLILWGVFSLGLWGMALEMVLLVAFQCEQGYVYSALGLLVGLFMMGIAFGTILASKKNISPPLIFPLLLLFAFLYTAVIPFLLQWGGGLIFFGVVNFLGALIVGASYPMGIALLKERGWKEELAGSWVYAFDVWGATLSAFFTTTLLITQLGMGTTCLFIGLLPALALVFLLISKLLGRVS